MSRQPATIALLLIVILGGCREVPSRGAGASATARNEAAGSALGSQPETPPVSAGRDPWKAAQARGIEFRAVGQEPGWYLEIDQEQEIHFVYDYADREARTPAPKPVVDGATTTYVVRTDAHLLRILIEQRLCTDVMSGQPFTHTVYVRIDGTVYEGCGQEL